VPGIFIVPSGEVLPGVIVPGVVVVPLGVVLPSCGGRDSISSGEGLSTAPSGTVPAGGVAPSGEVLPGVVAPGVVVVVEPLVPLGVVPASALPEQREFSGKRSHKIFLPSLESLISPELSLVDWATATVLVIVKAKAAPIMLRNFIFTIVNLNRIIRSLNQMNRCQESILVRICNYVLHECSFIN
jgi:hypothetical protein